MEHLLLGIRNWDRIFTVRYKEMRKKFTIMFKEIVKKTYS